MIFAQILIPFIILTPTFIIGSLDPLDKKNSCFYSITRLNTIYLILVECLSLYLTIEKKYIKYNKAFNIDF